MLDITRLASRPGRQLTGVDRVELAYLRELLDREAPVWGLARISVGYVLLDRAGLTSFYHRMQGRTPWGSSRLLLMFSRRITALQRQVQSDLWRLASAKVLGNNLGSLLGELPEGFAYLNVGHSNLTERTLSAISAHNRTRIVVMIHDTIPLDHPDTQRPESVERFTGLLNRTLRHADIVICNSHVTLADVERHMLQLIEEADAKEKPRLRLPGLHVAHLGIDQPRPDPVAIPANLPQERPLFLAVGTIEPRKNHALLLDVWEDLEAEGYPLPVLGFCGARGWLNEDFFKRLDASPMLNRDIFEWPDLSDRAIAALLTRSQALLFPSLAEGYGLPPVEAVALQTPVVSSNLPSVHEVLGDLPVYLKPDDRYSWAEAVKSLIEDRQAGAVGMEAFDPPTWEEHFKIVLKMT